MEKLLLERKTAKEVVEFLKNKYFQHSANVSAVGSSKEYEK